MSRKGLNIYKRKDGRWEARYIKSRNALGKPKYGYLYASSYREVRCDLQHTLQLQGKPSGSEERTRNSTFELVSMEWLDAFSINFKESTYIRYRTLIECYYDTADFLLFSMRCNAPTIGSQTFPNLYPYSETLRPLPYTGKI